MSTTEEVLEGTAEELTEHAIVRRERRSEVIRPLDAGQLVDSFHAYQELLPRLLTADDWQQAGRDKFVKKSGWRKIATAFDLDVQLIRSTVDRDENGHPLRAEVWARAIAPSGRCMDGDGYCSADEKRFREASGKSKLENDLRATATTRAMNRAISGLVGMGAVSAEEVDAGPPQKPHGPQATDADKFTLACQYLDVSAPELIAELNKLFGYIPEAAVQAVRLVARMKKAAE